MDMSIVLLAFGGYLGGMLVLSRTLRWAAALRDALRAPADGAPRQSWFVLAVLHSAPWLLALAIAAVWYVASLGQRELLWALVGGLAFAALFFVCFVVRFTKRRKPTEAVPLTPERLNERRREFYFITIAWWTIVQTAVMAWAYWATLDRDITMVVITAFSAPLGGWLFAWFMWQWAGTALEVAEKRRRQRAARS